MTQPAWQNRLTAVIAGQVRRYRRIRKLSARQVSEACAELGMEIHRQTLADLENGRRASISLAELLVLAQVLEVSPTLLVVPVDTEEKMEVLPGQVASTEDVLEWFSGTAAFDLTETNLERRGTWWPDAPGPAGYVHLYQAHRQLVDILLGDMAFHGWNPTDRDDSRSEVTQDGPAGVAGELRVLRRTMREAKLRVPDLPAALAVLDPPEPSPEELRDRQQDRMRHAVRRP